MDRLWDRATCPKRRSLSKEAGVWDAGSSPPSLDGDSVRPEESCSLQTAIFMVRMETLPVLRFSSARRLCCRGLHPTTRMKAVAEDL